jgi:ABC-type lipoprotein export system ATPase subunit
MSSLLSLRGVRKSYWRGPHETVVLDDLCLDVHVGEMVAIWGRRGSGKTTLLKVAAGLEPPEDGMVCFEGRDLRGRRPGLAQVLHEGLGWVQRRGPQSDDGMRIIDYVSLPLLSKHSRREAQRRASSILTHVGVRGCARQRWEDLTDSERTLVAIAHALVRRPKLLIADDPTVNLDLLQREEVMSLLSSAAERDGLGVLITVPDMPEMLHAHLVGSLSEGRLMFARERKEDHSTVVDFPGREQSA